MVMTIDVVVDIGGTGGGDSNGGTGNCSLASSFLTWLTANICMNKIDI